MSEFKGSAGVFRAYLKCLDTSGMRAAVRDKGSPQLQAAMDRPPFMLSWLPWKVFEDLYTAVDAVAGRDAVRQLAYDATRSQMGPLLRPIIQGAINFLGAKPSSLFKELNTIVAPTLKGATFTWVPETDTAGVIQIEQALPVSTLVFTAWEGALRFAFDTCNVSGVVEPHQTTDSRTATIRVHWTE